MSQDHSQEDYEALENLKDGDEALWVLERTGFRYGRDFIEVKVVGRTATRLTVETLEQRLQFMRKTYNQYAPMNSGRSILVPKTDYWIAQQDEQKRLDQRSFRIAYVGDPKRIRKLTDEQLTIVYDKIREYLAANEAKKKEKNGEQRNTEGV